MWNQRRLIGFTKNNIWLDETLPPKRDAARDGFRKTTARKTLKNMTTEEIEIGDVVKLNSGGPEMTVNSKYGEKVECRWMDHCGIASKEYFNVACLTKIPKNSEKAA